MSRRRRFNGPPNQSNGLWYEIYVDRLKFELSVKPHFPSLRGRKVKRGYEYNVTVSVPHYDTRKVRIRFSGASDVPAVFVDGPQESPHRYNDDSLCMWYPKDDVARRWTFADGLLALIGLIMVHLFNEAWWRETGDWLGEEVPHRSVAKKGIEQ